jgi:hypothetical protein
MTGESEFVSRLAKRFYWSPKRPYVWGSASALFSRYRGLKRPGREPVSSSPFNAELKNAWCYNFIPPHVCTERSPTDRTHLHLLRANMPFPPIYFPRDTAKMRMTQITEQHAGFEGYEELYLLGRGVMESVVLLPGSCWFLAWFILQPWRLRRYVPPKRRLYLNGLYGVISQKKELFTAK